MSKSKIDTPPGAGRLLTLARFALVVTAYVVLGRLAFLLAFPPTSTWVVWPPAGIALAAVIAWGYRMAPGVFVGSVLLSLGMEAGPPALAGDFVPLLIASVTALGQALGAMAGAYVANRFCGRAFRLDVGRDIIRFTVLAALPSALIAPSAGIAALSLAPDNPWSTLGFTWWSWYTAEAVGMLIFAPLVLPFIGTPTTSWRRRRVSVALPLGVTFLSVILAFVVVNRWELKRQQLEFERETEPLAAAFEQSMDAYVALLGSVARLFDSTGDVDDRAFATFVEGAFDRYPGLVGLCWHTHVSASERAAFEEETTITEVDSTGSYVRARERDAYLPARFVQLAEGHTTPQPGFDIVCEAPPREAIARARATGLPAATGRVRLGTSAMADGMLVCFPVYEDPGAIDDASGRERALRGVVLGALRIDEFLDGTLAGVWNGGVRLRIVDESAAAGANLFGVYPPPAAAPAIGHAVPANPIGWATHVNFSGRRWRLEYRPTPAYMNSAGGWRSLIVLVSGLIFTSVLGAFLLVITGRTSRIERLVDARTSALLKINEALLAEMRQRRQVEKALGEQEEVIRAMVEDVEDYAILMLDPEGYVASWNRGAEKTKGWKREEILGEHFGIFYTADDRREGKPERALAIAKEEGHFVDEGWQLRKDGTPFWSTTVITALRDSHDNLRGYSKVARDITERKRVEADLKRRSMEVDLVNTLLRDTKTALEATVSELERSNKELDDFAYIASHDLKEPLRGIHNYSTFLLDDYGEKIDEEGKRKLETLTRLTQRMESLIDSLLYYSRVGRLDLAVEETNLNEVLGDVVDSLHIRLQEENVELRVPAELPSIQCDRVRVGEVFRNLITNAMKYNDKDEKWIEVGYTTGEEARKVSASREEPVDAVFYVRDNGIGVRDKHLESIWRIFKRLHGRNKFGGGTGAGLTIVKKIVERHGGQIWVESVHGQGSTFFFTLEKEAKRDDERAPRDKVDSHR